MLILICNQKRYIYRDVYSKKFSMWNFPPLFLNIELVKSNKGSRMMLSKIIVAFEEMNT